MDSRSSPASGFVSLTSSLHVCFASASLFLLLLRINSVVLAVLIFFVFSIQT